MEYHRFSVKSANPKYASKEKKQKDAYPQLK